MNFKLKKQSEAVRAVFGDIYEVSDIPSIWRTKEQTAQEMADDKIRFNFQEPDFKNMSVVELADKIADLADANAKTNEDLADILFDLGR